MTSTNEDDAVFLGHDFGLSANLDVDELDEGGIFSPPPSLPYPKQGPIAFYENKTSDVPRATKSANPHYTPGNTIRPRFKSGMCQPNDKRHAPAVRAPFLLGGGAAGVNHIFGASGDIPAEPGHIHPALCRWRGTWRLALH